MQETLVPAPVPTEGNRLTEIIGKDKMRAIAALGIAAAGLFGITGKLNAGVGVAIETTNPFTGEPVAATVDVESTEKQGWQELGVSEEIMDRARGAGEIYSIRIGGARVSMRYTELSKQDGVVLLAVHPAADTVDSQDQRFKQASAEKR